MGRVEIKPIRSAIHCAIALWLGALLWFGSHSNAAQNNQDVRILELDKPIERELAGGQTHAYQIALAAGQFLHVVVEQRGIDIVVALFGPDDKQLVEVDSPNGAQGPEPVFFVTEATGLYRLKARSLEKEAKPGRYEVKIAELRAATPQDGPRIAAQRSFAQGEALRAQGTAEPLRTAIEKYKEALPLWRAAGDGAQEARTLNILGLVHNRLGQGREALNYYNQALQLRRALADRPGEATTLTNMAYVYVALGEPQTGLAHARQALDLWRALSDREGREGEVAALNAIAYSYTRLGDPQAALEPLSQTLRLSRELRDRFREAEALNNLGYVYDELGEKEKALEHFRQTLPLVRAAAGPREEAATLNNLGYFYRYLGESQQALEHYDQALLLSRKAGDRRGEAQAINNIGLLYNLLGEYQTALEYLDQARRLRQEVDDRRGLAITLSNVGQVYASMSEYQKALEYFNQALSLDRAVGDRIGEATDLGNIGAAYASSGEYQKALEHFIQALPLYRAAGDRDGEAVTLSNIGLAYVSSGAPAKALEYLEQSLPITRALGDRSREATTLHGLARVARDQGKLDEARAQIEMALNIVESLRRKVVSQELRVSYFASAQKYYEFYIDLLMRLRRERPREEHAAAALQASARARARGLLELLTEARADIRRGVDAALLERERSLQQRLADKADLVVRLKSNQRTAALAAALEKEIGALNIELQQVRAEIRQKSPGYAAITQPQPSSLAEIQRELLDADTLLLEYALGEERSYLWAVTTDTIHSYELPPRARIEEAAKRLAEHLSAPRGQRTGETPAQYRRRTAKLDAETRAATLELSEMALAPAAAELGRKRLVIVPDGRLQYIPFAVLPEPLATAASRGTKSKRVSPATPLVVGREIVSLPSASTLVVLRRELAGRAPAPQLFAALADPVFDAEDERFASGGRAAQNPAPSQSPPASATAQAVERRRLRDAIALVRLRGSGEEVEAIAKLTPPGQSAVRRDFAANYTAATSSEMARYRYVHFATHGLFNEKQPSLSGLALSLFDEQKREQNGLLRLDDVYNHLKLSADLVTLSACQTALGKDVRGEGLVGLTRGFMYAGAARVVASLWKVEDEGTKELMIRFYRGMLKQRLRPAAALRQAQISMLRQPAWRSPYYWSAFVLQGEWR